MPIFLSVVVNILLLLLILGFLILIHELGHFIAAKLVGARVDEFSIGMGPKLFSFKRGETEYMIKGFPIGGYVKILGEVEDDKNKKDSRSLINKSRLQRFFVFVAGVVMNFLFAVIVYYGFMFMFGFKWDLDVSLSDYSPKYGSIHTEDYGYLLAKDGGARDADWPEDGVIKSIAGNDLDFSYDIVDYIGEYDGEEVVFEVCNLDGKECELYNTVVSNDGKVGISISSIHRVVLDYSDIKWSAGFAHVVNYVDLAVDQIGGRFREAKESGDYKDAANTVSSPIGMYFIIEEYKQYGFGALLGLAADLSLTLAVMNILPIPALDGGRILLLLIESVLGRKLNPKLEAFVINLSFILLLLFMVGIVVKDIVFFESLRNLFN